MKIYQYYSPGFNSNVTLSYNNGLLVAVDVDAPIQLPSQHRCYFFTNEADFVGSCKQNKMPFTELKREVSFELFWDKYAYKVGKEEAKQQWAKLSRIDQEAAYDYIPAYNGRLKQSNEARRHPSTYLHKKTWR